MKNEEAKTIATGIVIADPVQTHLPVWSLPLCADLGKLLTILSELIKNEELWQSEKTVSRDSAAEKTNASELCASLKRPAVDVPREVASPQSFAPFLQATPAMITKTTSLNTAHASENPPQRQDFHLPIDFSKHRRLLVIRRNQSIRVFQKLIIFQQKTPSVDQLLFPAYRRSF